MGRVLRVSRFTLRPGGVTVKLARSQRRGQRCKLSTTLWEVVRTRNYTTHASLFLGWRGASAHVLDPAVPSSSHGEARPPHARQGRVGSGSRGFARALTSDVPGQERGLARARAAVPRGAGEGEADLRHRGHLLVYTVNRRGEDMSLGAAPGSWDERK